jgi:SOS-response transcriptional repressor LexA
MALVKESKRLLDLQLSPKPDGYNVGFNSGAASGQTVPHVHIHVIPRYLGDMADPRGGVRHVIPDKGNYLRPALPSGSPEPPISASQHFSVSAFSPSLTLSTGHPTTPLWKSIGPRVSTAAEIDLLASFIQPSGLDLIQQSIFAALRGWFGENAGAPGTNYQVAFTRTATGWSVEPVAVATPLRVVDASPDSGESDEPETHDIPGFVEAPAAKDKFTRLVPVYSLEAAAGLWGPESSPEEIGWAKAPGTAIKPGMFIARVRGHSMEPKIQDGSWNLFRERPLGSRDGKIVLVQFKSRGDLENGGRFTVKKYQSVKQVTEDDWSHEHIELLPLNHDYDPIIVTPHEAPEMVVVGEWISTID